MEKLKVRINLLEFTKDAALQLAQLHVKDMASRMNIVNKGKLTHKARKHVSATGSIPKVAPEGVSLNELTKMWEQINFSDRNAPGYANPNAIDDGGTYISQYKATNGLQKFIKNITERRTDAYGVPESASARKAYYENLYNMTKVIISKLRTLKDTNPDMFTHYLLEIAAAGDHCGGRYMNTIDYLYRSATGQLSSAEGAGVEAEVGRVLDQFKIGVVDEWVSKIHANEPTHVRNYVFKIMQRAGFRLPGQDLLAIKDEFHLTGMVYTARYLFDERIGTGTQLRNMFDYATVAPRLALKVREDLLPHFSAGRMVDVLQSSLQHHAAENDTFRKQLTGLLFEVRRTQGKVSEQTQKALKELKTRYDEQTKGSTEKSAMGYPEYQKEVERIQSKELNEIGWYSEITRHEGPASPHISHESTVAILEHLKFLRTR